jgi:cell division protein FtsI/penicillin-binding protein 2
LLVGSTRLTELLQRFYFNGPPFTDGFIKLYAGSFNSKVAADYQLANLAVGLEEISMTTVHAAVLAAIFSQSGQFFSPYLIDDVKNILGLGFYHHASRPVRVLADDLNFMRVKKAMVDVVEDKNGTGHRARSETVRVAIKTGTAGSSRQGLDAVIIGFFPVEKPRYAFAFRLQGAGKAELKGAFFLHDLLQSLYQK